MWKTVRSTSTTQAQIVRQKAQNLDWDGDGFAVVVVDGFTTMLFWSVKELSKKKKKKANRDNESRVKEISKDTGSTIVVDGQSLKRSDWKVAPCKLGVILESYNRHVGSCGKCKETVEDSPVNIRAAKAVGGEPRTPAQRELDEQAQKADDINSMAEVKTVRVAEKYMERGEEFYRNKEVPVEEESLSEMIDRLETALTQIHSNNSVSENKLTEIFDDLKEWVKGQDKIQKELKELDAEIQRLQMRKSQLQRSA